MLFPQSVANRELINLQRD